VLNAESVWEAIWSHEVPLYVSKDGRDITLREGGIVQSSSDVYPPFEGFPPDGQGC
jgi:hypothetical protein